MLTSPGQLEVFLLTLLEIKIMEALPDILVIKLSDT